MMNIRTIQTRMSHEKTSRKKEEHYFSFNNKKSKKTSDFF